MPNYNIDKLESDMFTFLRFPLAILVVLIHTYDTTVMVPDGVGGIVYESITVGISYIFCRIAVPIFFLISGYYFFYKSDFSIDVYVYKLRKRIRSLLIPYILWNLLMIVANVFFRAVKGILSPTEDALSLIQNYLSSNGWINMFWACNVWSNGYSLFGTEVFNSSPIITPMWFLRDLILVVVISPLIYILIKNLDLLFPLIALSLTIIIGGGRCEAFLYFTIGAFAAIKQRHVYIWAERFKKISISFAILMFLLSLYSYFNDSIYRSSIVEAFIFFAVFAIIYLSAKLCRIKRLQIAYKYSNQSFFVYAVHGIFIVFLSKLIVKKIIPYNNIPCMCMRYIVTPIACVLFCFLIYKIIKRLSPCALRYLNGGR